jgi:hypothetical protein
MHRPFLRTEGRRSPSLMAVRLAGISDGFLTRPIMFYVRSVCNLRFGRKALQLRGCIDIGRRALRNNSGEAHL